MSILEDVGLRKRIFLTRWEWPRGEQDERGRSLRWLRHVKRK